STAILSRLSVRPHEYEQGLRRRPERDSAYRVGHPLGLCRCQFQQWHSGEFPNRPKQTLTIWSIQGRRRHHGAGIWKILRNANLLFAWRVLDRTKSQRGRAARISQFLSAMQRRAANVSNIWV